MSFVNFIDFNTDLDAALSKRTSPIIQFHLYNGVQLLPNNPLPYRQTTNVTGGIELEDWEAFIVDCKGDEFDVTDNFLIERAFQDDKAQAQFDWSLTNIPYDFGFQNVYLKIDQTAGETFYSNAFQLTSLEPERTCRLDYKDKKDAFMQSINVQMFFWQDLKQTEKGSYYEVSTRNTVTTTVKSQKFERWTTDFLPNDVMIKIDDVFENLFVYVDLVRANLFIANEIKEFEAEENFATNIIKISFFRDDVYDPLYVAPTTPELNPTITLNSVVANGLNAIYEFTLANFTPSFVTLQYSSDGTAWTNNNSAITSPQYTPFSETGTWYFRIMHPEAISNIIQLDLGIDVEAFNDSASVEKGDVVDINVLFNDTLVGETTIISVSSPTNGTAVIIDSGTKIRYTHNDSSTTFDSFTYTISNGMTSDTATVDVTIFNASLLKSFNHGTGYGNIPQACLVSLDYTKYHDGFSAAPTIGDFIFNDDSGLSPYNGNNRYHAINGGRYIKINTFGEVTDFGFC